MTLNCAKIENTDILNSTFRWWANRDDLGGFRTLGTLLWPDWKPGRHCHASDRPKDSSAAFGILKNEEDGNWFFKDHVTGQSGGLVELLTRAARYSNSEAIQWLFDVAARGMENFPEGPRAWLPAMRERVVRFFNPDELRSYQPSAGLCLVGDSHIMRGDIFVIGGAPGVSKSRAAIALALAGASGPANSGASGPPNSGAAGPANPGASDSRPDAPSAEGHPTEAAEGNSGGRRAGEHSHFPLSSWFGLPVHRQFRTLIIQTENSRARLRDEFAHLDTAPLVPWIRISAPPNFAIGFDNDDFKIDLFHAIDQFNPDCIILDPLNAATHDSRQRDYTFAFEALRSIIPLHIEPPALGIVAHTSKPRSRENHAAGAGLMHLLAGSYILTSKPRCVFIMARATHSESDPRVLFFNPKNNNGRTASRSAWTRSPGSPTGFTPLPDFDWDSFDSPPSNRGRTLINLDHIRALFTDHPELELSEAAERLIAMTGVARNSAYVALNDRGRFSRYLVRNGSKIKFRT